MNNIIPGSGQDWMYVVGGVEIAAGLIVALAPRIGSFVVAAWLFGILINLLTKNRGSNQRVPARAGAPRRPALTAPPDSPPGRVVSAAPRTASV